MAMTLSDLLATPGPDNLAWKIVDILLPVTEKSGFTVVLSILASSLLLMLTITLGYWFIAGTISAASNGTVLKDQYHPFWGPLAIVIGVGSLVPLHSNGLSSVHYLLRNFIAAPSVNIADAITFGAAEYIIQEGHSITPVSSGGRIFAWNIVASEVCAGVHNFAIDKLKAYQLETSPSLIPDSVGRLVAIKDGQKVSWNYGPACGSVSLSYPSKDEFGDFGATRNAAAKKLIDDIRAIRIPEPLQNLVGKSTAFEGGDIEIAPEETYKNAIKYGSLEPDIVARVNAIGDVYDKAIGEAARKEGTRGQEGQRKKLIDAIKKYGFAIFVTYYNTISQLNGKATFYALEAPVRVEPKKAAWGAFENDIEVAMGMLRTQRRIESAELTLTADDLAFAGDQDSSLYADLMNLVTRPILDYLVSYNGFRPDPTADLMNVGSGLMGGAKAGFLAGLTATGVSNFWSSTAGEIVKYIMTPGWPLLGMAYVGGAMLAIVLPTMPMIYLIFGLAAFTLELIVASIAVLIWAFNHARMDQGDGFIGSAQAPGYRILFGLLLRLPVNSLASIASHLANVAVLNIFLFVWSFSFRGSQGGQAIGLATLAIGFALLMYIQWKLVVMIFGLNTNLSDRVAAWFGHATQSFGEHAEGNTIVAATAGGVSGSGTPARPENKPKKTNDENLGGGGKGRKQS